MSGLGRAGRTGSYCRKMGAGLGSECVVDGWGEGVRKVGCDPSSSNEFGRNFWDARLGLQVGV